MIAFDKKYEIGEIQIERFALMDSLKRYKKVIHNTLLYFVQIVLLLTCKQSTKVHSSKIEEEGYAFDSEIGKLTITSDAGTTAWRTDASIVGKKNEYLSRYGYDYSVIKSVEVVNGVKYIGALAFSGCSSLLQVKLPETLTSIGKKAFSGCSVLESVILPSNLKSIGNGAFSETGLKRINIPNSIDKNEFGGNAFAYCGSLTSIELSEGLTSIGDGAFVRTGLTSITLPASITNIGQNAFAGCSHLEIVIVKGSKPASVHLNAFNNTKFVINNVEGQGIQVPVNKVNEYKSVWRDYQKYIGVKR